MQSLAEHSAAALGSDDESSSIHAKDTALVDLRIGSTKTEIMGWSTKCYTEINCTGK